MNTKMSFPVYFCMLCLVVLPNFAAGLENGAATWVQYPGNALRQADREALHLHGPDVAGGGRAESPFTPSECAGPASRDALDSYVGQQQYAGLLIGSQQVPQVRDYYVSAGFTGACSVGSNANPWRTIGGALARARPGSTIYIAPGIYRETIESVRSGTADQPIRLVAQVGGDVIVTGTDKVSAWSRHSGSIYRA